MKIQSMIRIEDAVRILTYIISLTGFFSTVRYIALPYSLGFVCLYLISLFCEYQKRFLIPRWLLTPMAVLVIVFAAFRLEADDLVVVATEALVILLAMKLLEEKKFRDYLQIYLITLLLLTGTALLSTDIEFLLYLVFLLFLITIASVLLAYVSQDSSLAFPLPTLLKIASRASLITVIALPVTVFMFVILPRTSYPLLHFLNRPTHASTGFTDNVSLGKVSDIQEDATVIFRAQMERVDENVLYWRGIVLDSFDGTSWKRHQKERPLKGGRVRIRGKEVRQTIYLEPYGNRYLFALDKPADILYRNVSRNNDLTYALPDNIHRRTGYETSSTLSDVIGEESIDRDLYLEMPKGMEKTGELVRTLSAGRDQGDTVKTLFLFLQGGYRYSLENLPLSENPLEDFLFEHRYGNCEYFASAMAVMLRIAGIPSRLVGGYKGGYYNDAGGYYLVPQKNAHVWVEAFLDRKGWVRFDPTPGGMEDFVSSRKKDLLFRMKLLIDTMNYHWNAAILNYDFAKQLSLIRRIESLRKPSFRFSIKKDMLLMVFIPIVVVAMCFVLIPAMIRRYKNPEQHVLSEFLRQAGRYGYRKAPGEGLEEFVSKMDDEPFRRRSTAFVTEFQGHFYRDKKLSKETIQRLRDILRKAPPP